MTKYRKYIDNYVLSKIIPSDGSRKTKTKTTINN